MSPISRTTRAALAASVVALTMVVATACGPDNSDPAGAQTATPTAAATTPGKPGAAPIKLPTAEELKTWKFEDWDKWAQQNVITPAVKGFWDLKKILEAKPSKPKPPAQPTGQPTAQPSSAAPAQPTTQPPAQPATQPPAGDNGNDPLPKVVDAKAVPHPYAKNFHVNGKIFSQHEDGNYYECSGTVVSDPAHPGKSNLVWTASHCVHGGKGAGYYKNLMFAPAFNSNGVLSGGKQATLAQAEPYGEWSMTDAIASPQWPAEADHKTGGPWSQYDFAIVRVENPNGGDKSLEETVGGSVPVWFNAPRDQLTSVSDYGYPADAPFDGMELEHCDGGKPVRLSMDVKRPPMLTIGCNMTPGDSGGGWFATKDGKQVLVSDVSIGDGTWEAGPYLDDVAAKAMDYFSKKKK